LRLANFTTRSELFHPRLDVHDRSPVYGIESSYVNIWTIDIEDPTYSHPQAIRTILGSLSEDPYLRPLGISSGMSRHPGFIPRSLIEDVNNNAVTERFETSHRALVERRK
jgi:hypothetical protein